MNKIIFCQFSNKLLNPHTDNISDIYYNAIYQYREKDGYYKNDHFWEIPLWIAEIAGSLSKDYETELYIIENIQQAIDKLSKENGYILFSVLDVNKNYIREIVEGCYNQNFCIGGYVDFSYFSEFTNVKVFQFIKQFIEYLGLSYEYNLDYSLFYGYKTIPKLTLSKGCLNRCKFCTIEKTIQEALEFDILKQIEAFKLLQFKLIYLNDKTFSQANNYETLKDLYSIIKKYNKEFKGFIIQTTCSQVIMRKLDNLLKLNIIFAIELGIETFNDKLLYELNKPQTQGIIIQAMEYLREFNIKIIPNIIIGIINEDLISYSKTLMFLNIYKRDIYFLNIYNLAIYPNAPLSKEVNVLTDNDSNENIINKGFYSKKQLKDNEYFYNEVFKFAINNLK